MTNREAWVDVKHQVIIDEAGNITSGVQPTGVGIVTGNVAVDQVWGNFPLQPDDDRTDTVTTIGGGEGDHGYSPTYTYSSDTLRTADYSVEVNNAGLYYTTPAGNHTIATTGYSNYPSFIADAPNIEGQGYAGDGDTGYETIVPKVVGKTWSQAIAALSAANLDWNRNTVTAEVSYAVASGATVVMTVDALQGVKKGDTIYVDNFSCDTVSYGVGYVEVTATTSTSITFANAAEWTFDAVAAGSVWGVNSNDVRVVAQDPVSGDVVDEGTVVDLTVLYVD